MMTTSLIWPLVWVVLCFGLYAIVLRQLAKAVQPLRLRLAEEGEALLTEGVLSIEEESDVRMFLDNAYDGWVAVFLMLMMPAAMFYLLIDPTGTDDRATERSAKLSWLFLVSVFAANPFVGALAIMEFVVLAFVMVIATGSFAMLRAALRRVFHNLAVRHEAHAAS
jgi:hypothetical protein